MNRTLLVLRILAAAQVLPWALFVAVAVVVSQGQGSFSRGDAFLVLLLLKVPGAISVLLGVASCLVALVACVRQRRWGWVTGLGLLVLVTFSSLPSRLLGSLVGSQNGALADVLTARVITDLLPGLALALVALASGAGSRPALWPSAPTNPA
jgi:hypothetical protein